VTVSGLLLKVKAEPDASPARPLEDSNLLTYTRTRAIHLPASETRAQPGGNRERVQIICGLTKGGRSDSLSQSGIGSTAWNAVEAIQCEPV
jgi:hypothetical protein